MSSSLNRLKTPTSCLLLDISMPGMSGPDLYQSPIAAQIHLPVVFITGVEDESARSRLIQQGATDCLLKPLQDDALQDALAHAIGEA
ncbi:response regulator [Rhizobium grahamii]